MSHADIEALQRLLGPTARLCRRALTNEDGVALAPFTDHHIHVHLIDEHGLPAGGVAAALDLGGDPAVLARRPQGVMPHLAYAGAFLTVPGGYPSRRPWAPPEVVRVVASASPAPGTPGGARTAVDEMADAGASVIKVALNSDAGPVFDAATLVVLVDAAHDRGLPVVAHVEGQGMTRRALDAGIDALAHAPFTGALPPELVSRAVDAGQRWISTLAIHDEPAVAIGNLAAFHAAGGTVLYGTDLGNGDRANGLDVAELQRLHDAGVQGPALLAALTQPWPRRAVGDAVRTFVPGVAPRTPDEIPGWLARARVVPSEELMTREQ